MILCCQEVKDRSSEASTQGNLAVAYQAINQPDKAIFHYHNHLNIARYNYSRFAIAFNQLGKAIFQCHNHLINIIRYSYVSAI